LSASGKVRQGLLDVRKARTGRGLLDNRRGYEPTLPTKEGTAESLTIHMVRVRKHARLSRRGFTPLLAYSSGTDPAVPGPAIVKHIQLHIRKRQLHCPQFDLHK